MDHTKDLLSSMAADGVEPNAQTFAATFECIERSNVADKLQILRHYQQVMQEKVNIINTSGQLTLIYDQTNLTSGVQSILYEYVSYEAGPKLSKA